MSTTVMPSEARGRDVICCPPMFGAPIDEAQAAELADVLKAMADPAPPSDLDHRVVARSRGVRV